MMNDLIKVYGAVAAKEIRVPIETFMFIEKKRHWWYRSRIVEFDITQGAFKEFYDYMLAGGYTCYIEETKSGGILSKKTVAYHMVFTNQSS